MSWRIGQTLSYTLVPYEDTTGVPWYVLTTLGNPYPSFELAQIGIDDFLNVPDWDEIPNLGPGPSLHSQWSPGMVGIVTPPVVQSIIPQLLAASTAGGGGGEEPSFTGPPPLSGGELGPVPQSGGAPKGFRLLRPRRPPTA